MKWKLVSYLSAPAMMVTICVIIFIFSKCIFCKPIRIRDKKVNFQAAGLAVFLFTIGKILDTLFKTLACRPIGGVYHHWYFAYETCFGSTWIISLLCLLGIIIVFGGVFLYGRRMTMEQRADPNKFLYQLSSRFKPKYWYWEYVIFVRRIVIAFFAVSSAAVSAKLIFLFAMATFIILQWRFDPFASRETNQVCNLGTWCDMKRCRDVEVF